MVMPTALDSSRLPDAKRADLNDIWVFLVGMGIALMVLGVGAIGSSFIATLATVLVFGILLLLGGLFQIVTAFWGRSWRGVFLQFLAGVLYLVVGLFMVDQPLEAALGVTLLIAAGLLASGVLRMIMSILERFDGWGWMLASGAVSFLLGAAIWKQWPLSGIWVIGLFVGIEMICSGVSWLLLGLAARSRPMSAAPV